MREEGQVPGERRNRFWYINSFWVATALSQMTPKEEIDMGSPSGAETPENFMYHTWVYQFFRVQQLRVKMTPDHQTDTGSPLGAEAPRKIV